MKVGLCLKTCTTFNYLSTTMLEASIFSLLRDMYKTFKMKKRKKINSTVSEF